MTVSPCCSIVTSKAMLSRGSEGGEDTPPGQFAPKTARDPRGPVWRGKVAFSAYTAAGWNATARRVIHQ